MNSLKSDKMRVLGVMSGTSLDGLDLALCEFNYIENSYSYKIIKAETVAYDTLLKNKLFSAKDLSAENYFALNYDFGAYIGDRIEDFLKNTEEEVFAIASHGHTVFHRPMLGFSTQLGSGAAIAAKTGITTVYDFRSLDVANGGQGAPLVPIGDKYLFSDYQSCLNIGGIANISFDDKKGDRIAFDICFANMALNFLAEKKGKNYDENGCMAAAGEINKELLEQIQKQVYSEQKISLAREHFESSLIPLLENSKLSIENKLATLCEYAAIEIANTLKTNALGNVFVTGGGAYNKFLLERITKYYEGKIIIPDDATIQFKEALIFAFLGYLRLNEKINTLKSVTGAKNDSVSGAVIFSL